MSKLTTAMILAAGFGTRLKHLTLEIPKALVIYKGRPMIENVIGKLEAFGISNIIINSHHHHEKMEEYFKGRPKSNSNILLIHEKEILGTAGALKNAEKYLSKNDNFLVYNTDVDCEINLGNLDNIHVNNNASATLVVQIRKTTRYLLINEKSEIIGRTEEGKHAIYGNYNSLRIQKVAFCGIHILHKKVFEFIKPGMQSDIIPVYMNMTQQGYIIKTYDISDIFWKDLGIPENL